MSRGPGTRQREILRRLRLIRSVHLPDLWHALSGDPSRPWPNPSYLGCFVGEFGQSLDLYGRGTARGVRVAYRRAASSLQLSGQLELRYLEESTWLKVFVRLPMTEREKIAARGLRRRIGAFRDVGTLNPGYDRLGERDQERERARLREHTAIMDYFWAIDRYPPAAEIPPQAARILRQGISGASPA